jgi:hypothetical protein
MTNEPDPSDMAAGLGSIGGAVPKQGELDLCDLASPSSILANIKTHNLVVVGRHISDVDCPVVRKRLIGVTPVKRAMISALTRHANPYFSNVLCVEWLGGR